MYIYTDIFAAVRLGSFPALRKLTYEAEGGSESLPRYAAQQLGSVHTAVHLVEICLDFDFYGDKDVASLLDNILLCERFPFLRKLRLRKGTPFEYFPSCWKRGLLGRTAE